MKSDQREKHKVRPHRLLILQKGLSIQKMHISSTQNIMEIILNSLPLLASTEILLIQNITSASNLRENYEHQFANKIIARDMKNNDKQLAITDKTVCVACFNLQKVLMSPQSNVSNFYYKSKYIII